MDMLLQYDFMRKAFIVGILLAVIVPCIGIIVVLRRLSMTGDALSHTSLAGVALGLIMGMNPVLGASIACIFAAFGIEFIRKRFPKYSEISIAVVMSAGVGLAGVLSGFVSNTSNFNSFLFGSIVAITDFELWLVIGISLLVITVFLMLYKELLYMAFDESAAQLSGVPVRTINIVFTILTALTVSVASRTVGALIISSLMVIPVTCGMQFGKSFKQTLLYSISFAVIFTVTGLTLSFYKGLKPGATIVLTGVVFLILTFPFKSKKK
ncbi:iron chelate uptake ABC transporter family permease subunit [Anaerocolumna sedimenticola]|uniref:Iron chelate uptake ABC transporter family permease subunit n=1 Tax=Anaerocolumna sedimenticola TaxID=2696063 RepID=A0A6P1TGM1_9FIRM|nr:metal ABC transporter permease [Anaerocolumna sedimenticola]QHQ59437.1 iron chelate uptake ABC transporter family permease subunit [Anaerocolumna sedimenticola]